MQIYFMRHGHSQADVENKIESLYDSRLTALGIQQARDASEYYKFKGIEFDEILSSPLLRASETAEIIGSSQNLQPLYIDCLKEADRGILCGMDRDEAQRLYPRKPFKSFSEYYPNESGENVYALRSRAYKAINEIMTRQSKCVLVVSHGTLLNEIIQSLLAIPSLINEQHGSVFSFKDCEYIHFKYYENMERLVMVEKRIARRD